MTVDREAEMNEPEDNGKIILGKLARIHRYSRLTVRDTEDKIVYYRDGTDRQELYKINLKFREIEINYDVCLPKIAPPNKFGHQMILKIN